MNKCLLILFVVSSTYCLSQYREQGINIVKYKAQINSHTSNVSSFFDKWKFTLEPGILNVDFTSPEMGWSENIQIDQQKRLIDVDFTFYDSREYFLKFDEYVSDQANHYLFTLQHQATGILLTTGVMHDKASLNDGITLYRKGFGGQNWILLVGYQQCIPLNDRGMSINFYGRTGGYVSNDNIWVNIPFSHNLIIYRQNPRIGYRKYAGGGFAAQVGVEYSFMLRSKLGLSIGSLAHFQLGQSKTTAPIINVKMLPKDFNYVDAHSEQELEAAIVDETEVSINYGMVSVGIYLNFHLGK
ncbi:MAG: hypothetical protein HRT58_09765 [Crocinitomicaceae bacterium]|nr:hypothetical protein [Crocinitomicaceae bacterium]